MTRPNRISRDMTNRLARRPILRMNGAGNEILVLDLRGTEIVLSPEEARAIGRPPNLKFDQLMALHEPRAAGADAALRIYNIDGSRSAACGNGTRCVAFALSRNGGPEHLLLDTDAGPVETWRAGETLFTVDMGRPRLAWSEIPLARDVADIGDIALEPGVAGAPGRFSAVGMGNPHAVFFVSDAAAADLQTLGPALEHHPLFPERANISFAQILARDEILLRVWERGTGATKACGSAACAALVAAARRGVAERKAEVLLDGGALVIEWREDDHVLMTGPVASEIRGTLDPSGWRGERARHLTFGCRLNAFESEVIRRHAGAAGLDDAVIVNTCAVTAEAERQARQAIRRARRERPGARLIVTGCAARRWSPPRSRRSRASPASSATATKACSRRAARVSPRPRRSPPARATRGFLAVQNGCDHRCIFCVIPFGRGPSRSAPPEEFVEGPRLVASGKREIVLTGVDLTSYNGGGETLGSLARKLLTELPSCRACAFPE